MSYIFLCYRLCTTYYRRGGGGRAPRGDLRPTLARQVCKAMWNQDAEEIMRYILVFE